MIERTTEGDAGKPAVDVLAVMDDRIAWLERASPSLFGEVELAKKARAAVAELVAADREYDEARTAMTKVRWMDPDEPAYQAANIRLSTATKRRIAALRAFGETP